MLRRLVREGVVSAHRATEAIQDLLDLRITRYPHFVLLPRIWQLRHNFSAYDAAYIVLAGRLEAALVTRDRRLASGGHAARVELFQFDRRLQNTARLIECGSRTKLHWWQ